MYPAGLHESAIICKGACVHLFFCQAMNAKTKLKKVGHRQHTAAATSDWSLLHSCNEVNVWVSDSSPSPHNITSTNFCPQSYVHTNELSQRQNAATANPLQNTAPKLTFCTSAHSHELPSLKILAPMESCIPSSIIQCCKTQICGYFKNMNSHVQQHTHRGLLSNC